MSCSRSSIQRRARGTRAWTAHGALVIAFGAAATQAGCTPAPSEDLAFFARPPSLQHECNGPDGLPVPDTVTMDTYIVQTYDVPPGSPATSPTANSNDCESCIGSGACHIEHPRVCTCSGSVTATADNLQPELKTTRIPALDTTDIYCFRVLAVDNGTVGTFPPASCACNVVAWEDPTFLTSRARLCAVSAPAAVGPIEIRFDLRCPGDRSGGGGGGINNATPFEDCVFPPMN